jgi:hypothetical protein
MRAYLDQTYGGDFEEGRRGRDRPIQMDSLRYGAPKRSRPWAAGRQAAADARARRRRPPKPAVRVVPPPTSLEEVVARRLYDQLNAQKAKNGGPASWRAAPRRCTPAPLFGRERVAHAPPYPCTHLPRGTRLAAALTHPPNAPQQTTTPRSSEQPQSGEDPRALR